MPNFLPHSDAERQAMLQAIGVAAIDDLFLDIPAAVREAVSFHALPETGLSEPALQAAIQEAARRNQGQTLACFLGGGAYHRFVPMAVRNLAARSEFYTAYTPYQPEVSQGTLQMIYEFQSMICELTGMDVANASVYDGASATAEAALMALRCTKRQTVWMAATLHPDYQATLQTYLTALGGIELKSFDPARLDSLAGLNDTAACVLVQCPDFPGNLLVEREAIHHACKQAGAFLIVSADPVSLGVLEPPGTYGADIVTGDIQPLGNALSFGGPYGGYIACKQSWMRQLPGRLVGATVDRQGKRAYTLTLQTREQHIRREKATSNICTNQSLNILKATIMLSLLGPAGLRRLAEISAQRAHTLARGLLAIPGISLLYPEQPFLFEFAIRLPVAAADFLALMEAEGFLAGVDLNRFPSMPFAGDGVLVACTEMTTPEQIAGYIQAARQCIEQIAHEPPAAWQGKRTPAGCVREGVR